jgi:hypothetical protein
MFVSPRSHLLRMIISSAVAYSKGISPVRDLLFNASLSLNRAFLCDKSIDLDMFCNQSSNRFDYW